MRGAMAAREVTSLAQEVKMSVERGSADVEALLERCMRLEDELEASKAHHTREEENERKLRDFEEVFAQV